MQISYLWITYFKSFCVSIICITYWHQRTCWRGPFLAYTSPAVAPEMRSVVLEQSLKLVSIQILILISTLHCMKPSWNPVNILNTVKTFMFWFYFEQFHSINITISMYHFRVAEIHFYIENLCQTQSIKTTN